MVLCGLETRVVRGVYGGSGCCELDPAAKAALPGWVFGVPSSDPTDRRRACATTRVGKPGDTTKERRMMARSAGAAWLIACMTALFLVPNAEASRSCGSMQGGRVVVTKGSVACATAKRVFRYSTKHHNGNTPAGPRGWSCARISGSNSGYNGLTCYSPSQERAEKSIEWRFPT